MTPRVVLWALIVVNLCGIVLNWRTRRLLLEAKRTYQTVVAALVPPSDESADT